MPKRSRRAAGSTAGSESGGSGRESESVEAPVSFEASLDDLEAIVDRLESGDLPLEAALAAFERGVALTRRCTERLEAAERRIEVLVREGASWVTQPFEEPEETE
jgi:exodeoxyribonuclease VII small subunit